MNWRMEQPGWPGQWMHRGDGDTYRSRAVDLYQQEIGGLNNGWTHNWDDASYATAVLLAQDADPLAPSPTFVAGSTAGSMAAMESI